MPMGDAMLTSIRTKTNITETAASTVRAHMTRAPTRQPPVSLGGLDT